MTLILFRQSYGTRQPGRERLGRAVQRWRLSWMRSTALSLYGIIFWRRIFDPVSYSTAKWNWDNSPIIQFGTTLTQTPLTLNFKINEHFCKIPPHLDQSMLNKRTGAFYLSLKLETQLVLNNFEKRLLSVLHLLVLTRSYHNWSLLRSHASCDLRRWNSFRLQTFSEFSLKVLECKRKP